LALLLLFPLKLLQHFLPNHELEIGAKKIQRFPKLGRNTKITLGISQLVPIHIDMPVPN
jgi:hypothetical protein